MKSYNSASGHYGQRMARFAFCFEPILLNFVQPKGPADDWPRNRVSRGHLMGNFMSTRAPLRALRSTARITIHCAHYDPLCALRSTVRITIHCAYYDPLCALRSTVRITIHCAHYDPLCALRSTVRITWHFKFSTNTSSSTDAGSCCHCLQCKLIKQEEQHSPHYFFLFSPRSLSFSSSSFRRLLQLKMHVCLFMWQYRCCFRHHENCPDVWCVLAADIYIYIYISVNCYHSYEAAFGKRVSVNTFIKSETYETYLNDIIVK